MRLSLYAILLFFAVALIFATASVMQHAKADDPVPCENSVGTAKLSDADAPKIAELEDQSSEHLQCR